MRKLRIAYISSGTFVHALPYLRFFSRRGHEVHWITFTRPAEATGVIVHDVSAGVDPLGSRIAKWRYLLAVPRLRALLRSLRPDILHGHYVTSAGLLCMLSGFRPYVASVRGSDLMASMGSPLWRFLLRRIFARAALVHTVSEPLAEIVRSLGVPADRCPVLTQGVELESLLYRPRAENGTALRLICTRHLRDVYDPLTILKACALLKAREVDFHMTFAGAGPLLNELQGRAENEGLAAHLTFLGGFQNGQVGELLAGNDVYVSASRWDGTSISLLEAMACGTFPVVSRIPSNAAWITDGREGFMFGVGDAQELAEALIRANADRQFCREAVHANRAVVEQQADRTRNMLRLEQLYLSLLGADDTHHPT